MLDEQALALGFAPPRRRTHGMYFTPGPLVEAVLELARPHLPEGPEGPCRHDLAGGALTVVDPACGAGAFLAAAARAYPCAELRGLELSQEAAALCRERVPAALVLEGDGLRAGFERLLSTLPEGNGELWVGNPPYNGTSPLLADPGAYAALRAQLPQGLALPRGTSLRDDFIFFVLLAARRLEAREGTLAFVTPSTLLDAYLYSPVRQHLLSRLTLCEVASLGGGVFEGTQVRTCITVWRSRRGQAAAPRHRAREEGSLAEGLRWTEAQAFTPAAPEWALRPAPLEAEALDREWRSRGEPLGTLIPVSFTGLKTRFDELLVDEDPAVLLTRVRAFLRASPEQLPAFARAHGVKDSLLPKLVALRLAAGGVEADAGYVRPFFRYAGARHRGALPASAQAFCYLDRRLIPRGDHRLQGSYDPHLWPQKLLFNVRELPLSAALLEQPGCVPAHRHARFAPLRVPARVLEEGGGAGRRGGPLGDDVWNLSEAGLAAARRHGGPLPFFRWVVEHVNSDLVQRVWAPAYGASRELPVPLEA